MMRGEVDTLRLRLDDHLGSPASRGEHAVTRDRPRPRSGP
jgi:hypothetical protein